MNIVEFYYKCAHHDWTYEYSDCHSVFMNGSNAKAELLGLCKGNPDFQQVFDDWADYSLRGGRHPILFGIVNDVDKPCERLLAIRVAGGLRYVDPELRKHYGVMGIDRATGVEKFGIRIVLGDDGVKFEKVGMSSARYADGEIRQWQGSKKFEVKYETT